MLHPDTYLNKLVVAFADGSLVLYNTKTNKTIHCFDEFSGQTPTIVAATPDPDIVVLGFATGVVVFFELKKAQSLFSLKIEGAVSALSFRTDETAHLAVGSARGEIYMFDLDSRKLESIIAAHAKTVSSLWFVPQQPLFVTSSADNSIKAYLFESSEYRLLRQRSGHFKPPTSVRFLGEDSRFIVSAGSDRCMRFFSILKDNQNFEFSQGSTQRTAAKLKLAEEEVRLPAITALDIFETKPVKWDNMVTAHAHQSYAKSWRLDRKTIGQHTLEASDKSELSHVSTSACGNFALLSSCKGTVDIYNLQSGKLRKTIAAFPGTPIVATFTDATGASFVSISREGAVKRFESARGTLTGSTEVEAAVVKTAINRDTELIALACSDNVIRVFDFAAMRMVRIFSGHTAAVTDLVFSQNSKWLVSCSRDKTVRTWDLPSGKLADILAVPRVPVAVTLSKNMEILATCHEGAISISLWSNRSLYTGDCGVVESAIVWSQNVVAAVGDAEIRYSELPASRWKNIYFLEKIRANTKPVAAASKRNALPFFLTQTVQQDMAVAEEPAPDSPSPSSQDQVFGELLASCQASMAHDQFFAHLRSMHPSRLDFEVSCIPQERRQEQVVFVLQTLASAVKTGQSFELVQAILALTLRHHEGYMSENAAVFADVLRSLSETIKSKWQPLESLIQSSICLVAFAREQ